MKPVRLLAMATLDGLPPSSAGARSTLEEQLALLPDHGIAGVLAWSHWRQIQNAGMEAHAMGRLCTPDGADALMALHVDAGVLSTTLHIGTAFDSDAMMDRYAESVLRAAARHRHPVYVETHRATVTQDAWRTLRWVERFPELRFALDASHWYLGGEMDYGGGFGARLPLLDPVLRRSPMVQGRIASGGAIQTTLDDPGPWPLHAAQLWSRTFALRRAEAPGEPIVFCPELLPHVIGDGCWIGYAPVRRGTGPLGIEETSDRFLEALRLYELADRCAEPTPAGPTLR